MGLVGYYKRFIEGFSKIAHPITFLQKKGINFEWTPKVNSFFQTHSLSSGVASVLERLSATGSLWLGGTSFCRQLVKYSIR